MLVGFTLEVPIVVGPRLRVGHILVVAADSKEEIDTIAGEDCTPNGKNIFILGHYIFLLGLDVNLLEASNHPGFVRLLHTA